MAKKDKLKKMAKKSKDYGRSDATSRNVKHADPRTPNPDRWGNTY